MIKTYTIKTETTERPVGFGVAAVKTITRHFVLEDGISIAVTCNPQEAEEIRAYYEASEKERQALISKLGEEGYLRLRDDNEAG
jgi:hypothetical protein